MRRSPVVTLLALLVGAALAAPVAARSKPEPRLPNLFAYPPSWLVGPVSGAYPDYDPTTHRILDNGCLPEERAEGARRCLRFATLLTNFDLGDLRVVLRAEATGTNAYQVVGEDYRPAGTYSIDPRTGDVVLDDFYRMRMWRFDGHARTGRPVAETEGRGLCPSASNVPGPRQTCSLRVQDDGNGNEPVVALPWLRHVWFSGALAGQHVEISGVNDGLYVLEIQIDPENNIRESYERDNKTCVVMRLRGNEAFELRDDYCWPRRT